jgi:type I restriction enzyme, S subunit
MSSEPDKEFLPKLRFTEFRESTAWEARALGSFISLEYGEPLPETVRSGGEFPVIGSSGVVGRHNMAIVSGPAIVVGRKGSAGQVNWVDSDCYPIDTTFFVKSLESPNFELKFIFLLLQSLNLAKLKDDGAVPGINRNAVLTLRSPVPNLKEQQKIANCLSSLDDLITAQAQKIELLKTYKKGLMQQLFPAEGESVPRLRFTQFSKDEGWSVKEVGEIFRVTRGEVLSMRLVSADKSEFSPFPVYSSQTKNGGLSGYYSDYLYEDSITWTTDGANAGEVNYRNGKFFCTNVCGVLINTAGNANVCLASIINLVSRNYVSYVGNPKLMNGVMAKIEITIPSVEEQQKLSECLSSVDWLIDTNGHELEMLISMKTGLMQGLFPAIDEPAV